MRDCSHSAASIPIGTLLPCCQGIVVVGKEASTVPLAHFILTTKLAPGARCYSSLGGCGNMLELCEFAPGQSSIDHSRSQS